MASKKGAASKKISSQRKPTGKKKTVNKKRRSLNRFTPKRQAKFLSVLMETAVVQKAVDACGCSITAIYSKRYDDTEFAAAWKKAVQISGEIVLERELIRRAIEGVEEWKGVAGIPVRVRKYSDTLLLAAARAAMPDKYRENVHNEHSVDINLAGARERITAELAKFGIERPENKDPVS